MIAARSLDGLPPYGPHAIAFPKGNAFREGYVVEFTTSETDTWVGNFAKFDECGLCSVHVELGERATIVVAGGVGYIIDTIERSLICDIGFDIHDIWYEPAIEAIIVTNGLWFEAYTAKGSLWRTERISWDGFRNLKHHALEATGEAFDPTAATDVWQPFRVDLRTGQFVGGTYNGPPISRFEDHS
jgi:hypothetical protein